MHVYSEKDPVEIKFNGSVLLVACVFSWRKIMHEVKDLSLRIVQFWKKIINLVEGK